MDNSQEEQAEQLVEAFELFDDWDDKYSFLIDLGRKLPPLDEAAKTEENRIQGCQSMVWIVTQAHTKDGQILLDFRADSDSAIVKGLIAILRKVYAEQPPEKILAFDIEGLLERLELSRHLSLNRRNGLLGMVQRIKQDAVRMAARPAQSA